MARGYGMALLAAISVAYLIHSSSAQTTYTVGDTTGWTVPQNVGRKMLAIPGAGEGAAGGAGEAAGGAAGGAGKTTGVKPGGAAGEMPNSTPNKNSATSLGFAGFTTFLSIFVALCY